MKHLKPFVNESRNIGTIYHFTSLINTYHIIKDNQMVSYREIDDSILDIYRKSSEYDTTFSFTRDKNMVKKIGQGQIDTFLTTRLDFDGTKLSNKYKIRPYNYQNEIEKEELNKRKRGENYYDSRKLSSESEQVLITNNNVIENIDSYMTGMVLPSLVVFREEFEFYVEADVDLFYKLEPIVNSLGYDDFNEYEREFNDDMIEEVYNHIIDTIDEYSSIDYKIGVV